MIVGSPLNFRGLVYGPMNEQGAVYLFGLKASDPIINICRNLKQCLSKDKITLKSSPFNQSVKLASKDSSLRK